jgi:putative methyltransferase (TIGR04325 family)
VGEEIIFKESMALKGIIKKFLPPSIIHLFRVPKKQEIFAIEDSLFWSGDFSNWEEAKANTTGYDNAEIVQKCTASLLKVKNGEALYERDSVLFDEIQYSSGLLAGLQNAALDNSGKLTVLDFGGSLGSSFFQNIAFLNGIDIEWCIVEQRDFVNAGKKYFQDSRLKFYSDVEECLQHHKPTVLLLSSVLQYLEDPYEQLQQLIKYGFPYIIIDRTSFVDDQREVLTVQKVPENIYKASYPCWFFNETRFLSFFKEYTMRGSFSSFCDGDILLNEKKHCYWKGFLFSK